MSKGGRKEWSALYRRYAKGGGGRVGAELRRLAALPPEELAAELADADARIEQLKDTLEPVGELDQVLARLQDDGGETDRLLEGLIAETELELKPVLRRLQRDEQKVSDDLRKTLDRWERGEPEPDPAVVEADLREFLNWQRRR